MYSNTYQCKDVICVVVAQWEGTWLVGYPRFSLCSGAVNTKAVDSVLVLVYWSSVVCGPIASVIRGLLAVGFHGGHLSPVAASSPLWRRVVQPRKTVGHWPQNWLRRQWASQGPSCGCWVTAHQKRGNSEVSVLLLMFYGCWFID